MRNKHKYLLAIPEKIWFELCRISSERGISIKDTILNLIAEGLRIEKIRDEEIRNQMSK